MAQRPCIQPPFLPRPLLLDSRTLGPDFPGPPGSRPHPPALSSLVSAASCPHLAPQPPWRLRPGGWEQNLRPLNRVPEPHAPPQPVCLAGSCRQTDRQTDKPLRSAGLGEPTVNCSSWCARYQSAWTPARVLSLWSFFCSPPSSSHYFLPKSVLLSVSLPSPSSLGWPDLLGRVCTVRSPPSLLTPAPVPSFGLFLMWPPVQGSRVQRRLAWW